MADPNAAASFLRVFAAAVTGEGDPAALAARAVEALGGVFAGQKSLVLDVQFTGFTQKGQLVGGVDPAVLRAAGRLITLRVSRVGFTPDASAADLETLFALVAKQPAEIGPDGVTGRLAKRKPLGIYVSAPTGEVYRPPAKPKPEPAPEAPPVAEEAPAAGEAPPAAEAPAPASAETPAAVEPAADVPAQTRPPEAAAPEVVPEGPAAGATAPAAPPPEAPPARTPGLPPPDEREAEEIRRELEALDAFAGDGADLSDFELVDEFPVLPAAQAPAGGAPLGSRPDAGVPGSNDMFHFFRAVDGGHDAEEAELPRLLAAADNVTRFDELAQAAARTAQRLVRTGDAPGAVALLDALVREAERPDRTRMFRESAAQALRRVGTGETLSHLGDLLQHGGEVRDRLLHVFLFLGGETVPLLESVLFRTPDAELRRDVFRALLKVEGMGPKLLARAMADPSPARARSLLELATEPPIDPETGLKWVAEAAAHPDAGVRAEAAKHATILGGRGGLRILLDLMADREPAVRRAATLGVGTLGDATAVPFLARMLTDAADEDEQLAVIATLGRLGSPEALPALLSVVNRRSLFGGKRWVRVKTAAVAAIGRIPAPAARDVLESIAAGKDADLAPEARRVLATL